MDTTGYVSLSRQVGLAQEMQAIANNIANMATAGYRAEGVVFSEYVRQLEAEGGSVAFTRPGARVTSDIQGALKQTGGTFDLAIDGPGYFTVDTGDGIALTRAGGFSRNAVGELVSTVGDRLLDIGGAPIFVPPDARAVSIAGDGTLTADGLPIAQVGRVIPEEGAVLTRTDGVKFRTDAPLAPAEEGTIVQGFLEEANVNPVAELARMIEVQRAYEAGQRLMDREDERMRQVLRTATARS